MEQDCDGGTGCVEHARPRTSSLLVEDGSELKEDMWTAGSTRVREAGREDAVGDPFCDADPSRAVGADQERHLDRALGAEPRGMEHADRVRLPFRRLAA